MNSFPFVRHHFLRAGFEVVDCPPLTAQLKNSSDIRMVMDVRDFLTHETYFDEFIILSGDADFTPVLHRLRAHARRTVIFANDYTATPYTAICDGEVRESDLVRLLVDGQLEVNGVPALAANADHVAARGEIIAEVVAHVRGAGQPLPLEALAERAVRMLGHERTAGSGWAGSGSFRELLLEGLPADVRLTDEPPYYAYVAEAKPQPSNLVRDARGEVPPIARRETAPLRTSAPPPAVTAEPRAPAQHVLATRQPAAPAAPVPQAPRARAPMLDTQPAVPQHDPSHPGDDFAIPQRTIANTPAYGAPTPGRSYPLPAAGAVPAPTRTVPAASTAPAAAQPRTPSRPNATAAAQLQQSVTRIYEACQAPPLAPPEYRKLFEAMAAEITENGLQGSQTLANVQSRALANGLQLQRDDVRFVLDVVSEPDPWFEQGASANLFAGRFRNFVVARCRAQGLSLSVEELDLIEAWFTGGPEGYTPGRTVQPDGRGREPQAAPTPAAEPSSDNWWRGEAGGTAAEPPRDDEFPRIVRSRIRG
jgi:hypothetical protein